MALHHPDLIVKRLSGESGGKIDLQNLATLLRVQTKTSDYTVTEADHGTVFTTHGATGAVNFTLPGNPKRGLWFLFLNSVGQNMQITAATADTLITFNDAAADNVIFSTAGNLFGALALVIADGNAWHVVNLSVNTMTVNT